MDEPQDETVEEVEELTAEDIVDGLRGLDADKRQAALNALFPAHAGSGGALVVEIGTMSAHYAVTPLTDAGRMFNILLALCEQFGTYIGLQLNWTQKQPGPNRLQLPPGTRLHG